MIWFNHILCPIDFSDASAHAIDHAVAIARWYDGRITAVHVLDRWFGYEPPILFAEPGGLKALPATREAVALMLDSCLQPAARAQVSYDTRIEQGATADCLLECARGISADLIVIGTHGRSGFERFLLGSVTEKVLRKANCPVLTVPPRAATTSFLPFAHVLCAIDFSEPSLQALQVALSISKESDAQLTALHVIDWRDDDMFLAETINAPDVRLRSEARALQRLDALIPDDARMWCRPSVKVSVGAAYRQIVSEAADMSADLIVIGVRGRNALDLALLGSTTNQVVRRASCPVLTIREKT